ncbi:MAG: radical SAM protein [Methanospirillaceae archaeon]|nr:radical SAM protein [Methanospirillaceae archaeon]
MDWIDKKSLLLATCGAHLTGVDADEYITRSTAGPGAGGPGSFFLLENGRRVRLCVDPGSEVVCMHHGGGAVTCDLAGETFSATLEKPGLHCPRQAYITVTESCTFSCRYCSVPKGRGRKTKEGIVALIESVLSSIDAISLTSGVLKSIEEEEEYVLSVVRDIRRFSLPIGVSIVPTPAGPLRMKEAGVYEVKFNLETATDALFSMICPGLSRAVIFDALRESVPLFGRGHVFSNIIFGLGETDEELATCMRSLAETGIIPILRPLYPAAALASLKRPGAERIKTVFLMHRDILSRYDLDVSAARTMCPACTGCDLIPGVDS